MASRNPYSQRQYSPAEAETPTTFAHDGGIVQRRRERHAERKLARLLTPRSRRALVTGVVTSLLSF
jgi:hypothetical protein